MNPIVKALAEDAIAFPGPGQTPPEHLRAVIERLGMAGQDRVMERLGRLLQEAHDVLAQCPAERRLRRAQGGPCGVWFVRYRADNQYCSSTCAHRAGTQVFRNRPR